MAEPLQAVAGEVAVGVVAVAVLGPAQALLAYLKVLQGKALRFIIEVVCAKHIGRGRNCGYPAFRVAAVRLWRRL